MTRAVILAAGTGSRLMPLTQHRPKGMVPLAGLPLLVRQISTLRAGSVADISLVGGHCAQQLESLGLPVITNPAYDSTNMVESLMCARALFDGRADLLMCYGDIIYEPRVLRSALETPGDVVIVADREWRTLWSARMEDYSSDVESFRVREDGSVAELGKRPKNLAEVKAQYIGLVRFPAAMHQRLLRFYDSLDRTALYDGQPFPKMYMTSFIQRMIDAGWNARPALISNGWLEVDTLEDLRRYERMAAEGRLGSLCELAPPPDPRSIVERLLPSPVTAAPGTCDIAAIAQRVAASESLDELDGRMLDRVARKIEIAGTLHRNYSLPEMRPAADARPATSDEAGALLAAYLLAFDRTHDARHLNTVLKALDGVLRVPRPAMHYELDSCCATRLEEHA